MTMGNEINHTVVNREMVFPATEVAAIITVRKELGGESMAREA